MSEREKNGAQEPEPTIEDEVRAHSAENEDGEDTPWCIMHSEN